jgi:hypothetical protein
VPPVTRKTAANYIHLSQKRKATRGTGGSQTQCENEFNRSVLPLFERGQQTKSCFVQMADKGFRGFHTRLSHQRYRRGRKGFYLSANPDTETKQKIDHHDLGRTPGTDRHERSNNNPEKWKDKEDF